MVVSMSLRCAVILIMFLGMVQCELLRLLVAYCPNSFSGEAAVVLVDPRLGNWSIETKVKLPSSEVFGCVADYDPTFDFDRFDNDTLWFDFVSDDGAFLAVDMKLGNTTTVESSNDFFTGFINFKQFQEGELRGIAGAVSQSGFCSDGCLAYGIQDVVGGRGYRQLQLLPFKEGADDTSFVNWNENTWIFQGSYDLRETTCGPVQDSQCLIKINATNGELISAIYTPSYQVFKFAKSFENPTLQKLHKSVLSFASGNVCNDSEWSYQFLSIDLDTAAATVVSCVRDNLVLDENEWVASFSDDNQLLATGSGNGNGDDPQLVVLDVLSGSVVLNSPLDGLAKALHADMGLVFLWALEFV